jgi:hypothetical protein
MRDYSSGVCVCVNGTTKVKFIVARPDL